MFWIQLTRTNAVFSRIALVSRFYAENQLSEKSVENMEKSIFKRGTHGTRRPSGGGRRGAHTTWWRGWAQAAPPHGVATSATPPTPLRDYKTPFDLKTEGDSTIAPETLQNAAATENPISDQKLRSGTLPGRGIGGDHRRHRHRCFSIDHPCFPHPCVSKHPL